ncbi:MAG: UvrB/UvrC motif-containing protein [Planctomycetes bacterium]|nr:UvrB/UvrC motif-containing protein [Planctomycetota bacterium]
MDGLDAFMNCDCCKKNTAPIRISDIEGNAVTQQFAICTDCMTLLKRMIFDPAKALPSTAEAIKQVQEMLSSTENAIVLAEGAKPPAAIEQPVMPTCPKCGMTLAEFKQRGRFGCANDYEIFGAHIEPLLERVHDASPARHKGRSPQAPTPQADGVVEISRLKKELDSAVQAEKYEEAAKLRDRIAALGGEKPAKARRKRKEGKA